jgi:hypothetical protein
MEKRERRTKVKKAKESTKKETLTKMEETPPILAKVKGGRRRQRGERL